MMLLQSARMALGSVRRNKLRSALTMLGVVIGVGAVIAMVTLGQSASDAVTSDIAKMGQNLLVVRPGVERHGPVRNTAPSFDEDDVKAVAKLPQVGAVAPAVSTSALVVAGNTNHNSSIEGSTNAYFEVRGYKLAEGRFFSDVEMAGGQPACVIGSEARNELFGGAPALGSTLRIKQVTCRVIGVLEAKGASTFGPNQDDLVVMPMRVVQRRLQGTTDIATMYVSAASAGEVSVARRRIEAVLRERRRIAIGEVDNFQVRDMREIIATVSSIAGVLTTLLGAIAAVSLLVGGIGIMNIMLVSVTERTKEIGLRLAIGARTMDVLWQFLVEAIVLSLLGGIIGVAVGLGGSWAAAAALHLPFRILPEIVLLAFVFSGIVGVLFGYLPARKAASLNPIEALRHE